MSERPFRKPESYEAETISHELIPRFLQDRGFVVEEIKAERKGKTIVATTPNGKKLTMRVRLCWRREEGSRDSQRMRTFSAAQLLANIKNGDWVGSLAAKVERDSSRGITHFLFVQRDDKEIKYAALVPVTEIVPIWTNQRDISDRLLKEHKLGRRRQNHAMNGSSPTVYLQDDRGGQEVAEALWNHPGVINIADLQVVTKLYPEEAVSEKIENSGSFQPGGEDQRETVQRQIKERRGQRSFRDALRKRFGDKCVVTDCEVLDVLEAAHIKPYRGLADNHPDNGILVRADIHTLFDLDLLAVDPDTLCVKLSRQLENDTHYGYLEGKILNCSTDCRPSIEALRARFEQFTQHNL